jgi:translation initiation factor 2 alpha subunit (eIF-2alpha)
MEEGEVVLCTVERIESTTVFVKLPDGREGTLIISEIAPGRIKNLREYVVPNKRIACKILRLQGDRINVSLRRVSSKEKKEVMEKFDQEQTIKSAFKQILKEKAKEIEDLILKKFPSLFNFVEQSRENEKILEEFIPKQFLEQIKKVIQKKKKEVEVKKTIKLKCLANDGMQRIKNLLVLTDKSARIIYLAAGTFTIDVKSDNYKDANNKVSEIIKGIEVKAKQSQCEFEVLDK